MNAAIDTAMLIIQNAIWRLRMSRGKGINAADIAAIAILEDACKRVLKGDAQ